MRTALRELIDDLNKEIANCERNGLPYRGIYLDARWKAENLLEKEKQQIVDAVNSQRQIGRDEKGEDYYRSILATQTKLQDNHKAMAILKGYKV